MKLLLLIPIVIMVMISCKPTKSVSSNTSNPKTETKDTIRIANDDYDYEIIIIDIGFYSWLAGRAKPRGFYSENYLETKNNYFVTEWNNRVLQPLNYNPNLYEMQIDYNPNIHYGYEVNYLLYNYFIFFQQKNNQNLGSIPNRP